MEFPETAVWPSGEEEKSGPVEKKRKEVKGEILVSLPKALTRFISL